MTTNLHELASRGKVEKFERYVDGGKNMNRQEPLYKTPLIIAAACNHANVVEFLINRKADLNIQECHGWTALHLAALKGHQNIASILIKAGADQSIKDNDGKTAKDLAVEPAEWVPAKEDDIANRKKIAVLLK